MPNAEEHLVKAQLVFKLGAIMKQRRLKQVEAADLSVMIASKLIQRNLTKEDNARLIEQALQQALELHPRHEVGERPVVQLLQPRAIGIDAVYRSRRVGFEQVQRAGDPLARRDLLRRRLDLALDAVQLVPAPAIRLVEVEVAAVESPRVERVALAADGVAADIAGLEASSQDVLGRAEQLQRTVGGYRDVAPA